MINSNAKVDTLANNFARKSPNKAGGRSVAEDVEAKTSQKDDNS